MNPPDSVALESWPRRCPGFTAHPSELLLRVAMRDGRQDTAALARPGAGPCPGSLVPEDSVRPPGVASKLQRLGETSSRTPVRRFDSLPQRAQPQGRRAVGDM